MKQYPKQVVFDLLRWIETQEVGSLRVRKAEARFDEDSAGRPALFIDLVLADPAPGEDTWPVHDVLRLQRTIDDHVEELGLEHPWHVSLQGESPDDFPSDEDDEDVL